MILNLKNTLKTYFTKFVIVGLSGMIVNQTVLAILIYIFDLEVKWAGIVAIETSIISNFLLNNFWTWRDRNDQSIIYRFIKYHLVTLISGVVNYIILIWLTNLGLNALISNLIGIIIGMLINFMLNHIWTFNQVNKSTKNAN